MSKKSPFAAVADLIEDYRFRVGSYVFLWSEPPKDPDNGESWFNAKKKLMEAIEGLGARLKGFMADPFEFETNLRKQLRRVKTATDDLFLPPLDDWRNRQRIWEENYGKDNPLITIPKKIYRETNLLRPFEEALRDTAWDTSIEAVEMIVPTTSQHGGAKPAKAKQRITPKSHDPMRLTRDAEIYLYAAADAGRKVTVRELAAKIGCGKTTAGELQVWKRYKEARKNMRKPRNRTAGDMSYFADAADTYTPSKRTTVKRAAISNS